MNLTESQHQAIVLHGHVVVTAGAGSGKTRVLVERYLRILCGIITEQSFQTPAHPGYLDWMTDASSILAITFTDKAAREMRDRIRIMVEDRTRKASRAEQPIWEERRAAVESARIGTIHSFCTSLLRDHPAETGLDPCFTTLDETETTLLLTESIQDALGNVADANFALLEEFSPHELRMLLTDMVQQGNNVRTAIDTIPPSPQTLLDMWHSRLEKTKRDLLHELYTSPPWHRAWTILNNLAPFAPHNDIIGQQIPAIVDCLQKNQPRDGHQTSHQSKWTMPDFSLITTINLRGGSKKNWSSATELEAAKEALRTLRETYKAYAPLLELQPDTELEQRSAQAICEMATIYRKAMAAYERSKEQQHALDFDDLVRRTREVLVHHPHVRKRWQQELHAVFVDEFQDTDDEQRAIIYALTGLDEPDPPQQAPSLFIVGDSKQSIYRFRGADVRVFRTVEHDIRHKGGYCVHLDTSFRTQPILLNWINTIAQATFARGRAHQPYEVSFESLQAHRSNPPHEPCVELHIVAKQYDVLPESAENTGSGQCDAEAQVIAARIQSLVKGDSGPIVYDHHEKRWRVPNYGDFALLFRASTAFEYYEQALHGAGIPYLTTAGRGYYERKEVQDLINLVAVINDPMHELALVGVLRSPLFAVDDATILRLRFANPHHLWDALMQDDSPTLNLVRDTLQHLHTIRGQVPVVELLRTALNMTGYMATISSLRDGTRKRANIEKLLDAARRTSATGLSNFSAYLEQLLKIGPREGEAPLEATGSVRLMTVHRSKGLEFPIVVLPDLGRRPPIGRNVWMAHPSFGVALRLRSSIGEWQNPVAYHLAQYEEQRMERAERERLLYVALTRAQDYLILSGPPATKSGDDWLSTIVKASNWSWEDGGPPNGTHGCITVWKHT